MVKTFWLMSRIASSICVTSSRETSASSTRRMIVSGAARDKTHFEPCP